MKSEVEIFWKVGMWISGIFCKFGWCFGQELSGFGDGCRS